MFYKVDSETAYEKMGGGVGVAEQVGSRIAWLQTQKTGFVTFYPILIRLCDGSAHLLAAFGLKGLIRFIRFH